MSKQYTLTEEDKKRLINRMSNIGVAIWIVGLAVGFALGRWL